MILALAISNVSCSIAVPISGLDAFMENAGCAISLIIGNKGLALVDSGVLVSES